jgi:hypothetical protein
MFLIISIDMQTALAPGAYPTEVQWLEGEINMGKLRYVPSRNTNATASRTAKQNSAPLQAFI